jgi:transcriptional regulator with XRE-family HTH domain
MARTTSQKRQTPKTPKILEGQYRSVAEMLRATAGRETAEAFENSRAETRLIDALMILRNKAGLTQQDLARKLGCTQSKVSKMEASLDADLRFGDIVAYAQAVGHSLDILLPPTEQTLVEQVKMHAATIQKLLHRMADLAGRAGIQMNGMTEVLDEAGLNLVRLVQIAAKNLPEVPVGEVPSVRVESLSRAGDVPESAPERNSTPETPPRSRQGHLDLR